MEPMVVNYTLTDKKRLFDLGQGMYTMRKLVIKKGRTEVVPFTDSMKKFLWQGVAFVVLALAQICLMFVGGATLFKGVLVALCVMAGSICLTIWRGQKAGFKQALAGYLRNGTGGTLRFDENGITEEDQEGCRNHFPWDYYEGMLVSDEAIVVASELPVMLIFDGGEAMVEELRTALQAFGKGDTVYRVTVKEKK